MKNNYRYIRAVFVLGILGSSTLSHAVITKVPNGDDGTDLEGATPVNDGPLIESRKRAVELLQRLNTAGVSGLGVLLPEVEHSTLYLAKKDVNADLSEDQGAFHADMRGQVYARTFSQPHAATRFFPIALKLDQDQLVALHIHEGLHRSLPAPQKDDEAIVGKITLAITSPEATYDHLREIATNLLPLPQEVLSVSSAGTVTILKRAEPERYPNPSSVGYTYKYFEKPTHSSSYPVDTMHEIQSFLYPFGGGNFPLGIGIEGALISRQAGTEAGPLGVSVRFKAFSRRGFDISVWTRASLNMLSAEELKNSPLGRDIGTVGISMRKELDWFYLENRLSYSTPGSATEQIGQVSYQYNFGSVVNVAMHLGAAVHKLHIGGYADVDLADYYKYSGGAFSYDTGRYRLISGGPELGWIDKDFAVTITGKFLLNATKNANYDYLGDLMGAGVSQGNLAASLSIFL